MLLLVVFLGEFFLVFVFAQGLYEVVDAGAEGAEEVYDAAWTSIRNTMKIRSISISPAGISSAWLPSGI